MLFIYIHGFNSSFDPDSQKVQELSSIGKTIGINYNSFATYDEIFQEISSQVPNRDDLVFVGTSLGGFWAAEMARKFATPSVIINPCYNPCETLKFYIGNPQKNYKTSEMNNLTLDVVNTYPLNGISKKDFAYLPLVLLDMGDEVLSSKKALNFFDGFPIKYWEGGSHRFEHMNEAIKSITEYINICSFVEDLQ